MEFDDQEIHLNNVVEEEEEEEPSAHDLPSPPFPLTKDVAALRNGGSKTDVHHADEPKTVAAAAAAASAAVLAISASSPSRESSSQDASPPSSKPVSTTIDPAAATLTGQFKDVVDSSVKDEEVKMETGEDDDDNDKVESPTHYAPPQHLLTANRYICLSVCLSVSLCHPVTLCLSPSLSLSLSSPFARVVT